MYFLFLFVSLENDVLFYKDLLYIGRDSCMQLEGFSGQFGKKKQCLISCYGLQYKNWKIMLNILQVGFTYSVKPGNGYIDFYFS